MRKLCLTAIAISILGWASCNNDKKPDPFAGVKLTGQVYMFAPEFDTVTGAAVGQCDCCAGNVYFLTDSTFMSMDYCLATTSFSRGKYAIKDGNLILFFDGQSVTEEIPEVYSNVDSAVADSTTADTTKKVAEPQYTTNLHVDLPLADTYKAERFKDKIIFKSQGVYGARDNNLVFEKEIAELKKGQAWRMLKL